MSKDKVEVSTTDSSFRKVSEMMEPLPETQNGKEFVLMDINYVTQRVDAVANSSIKAKDAAQFVYKNICTRIFFLFDVLFSCLEPNEGQKRLFHIRVVFTINGSHETKGGGSMC